MTLPPLWEGNRRADTGHATETHRPLADGSVVSSIRPEASEATRREGLWREGERGGRRSVGSRGLAVRPAQRRSPQTAARQERGSQPAMPMRSAPSRQPAAQRYTGRRQSCGCETRMVRHRSYDREPKFRKKELRSGRPCRVWRELRVVAGATGAPATDH